MKKSFLVGIFVLLALNVHAQKKPIAQRVPDGGGPTILLKGEPFIGTWEWSSSTEVFRLTISRDQYHQMPNGEQRHEMIGMHFFNRNGVVLADAINDSEAVAHGGSFIGRPFSNSELQMFFVDALKHKTGKVLLTINPTTPNQMQFEVQPTESATIVIPNAPTPQPGYTFPTSMTLTRVP